MTRALLIYPEFRSLSFWNLRQTCRLTEARYFSVPLGLCTVAALLPTEWEVTLIDRNVEELDDSHIDAADIIFLSAMMPQQRDCVELIQKARSRGKRVVVGGPDPTGSPHIYSEADHLVLYEAEVTLPLFLADLAAGSPAKIYEDSRKADLQTSPTPRFELLALDRYNHVGVQWCRGCPFNCEFCDIIEFYGRVPRAKSSRQMLAELQKLYELGYRGHVSLVDDNFIGNKKLVKQFLPDLSKWQEERNWPFEFSTEASINLADDTELMKAMQQVGFFAVFIGIESPDEQTLRETHKHQNTHRSIAESIRKIYAHGIFVIAGFIVGFDTEKGSVAAGIIDCVERASIPVNVAGMLVALPKTQLMRRLKAEGRLHENFDVIPEGVGDQCTAGLNFETLRPRVDILRDYLKIEETIYTPQSYFNRVSSVGLQLDSSKHRFHPGWKKRMLEIRAFCRMLARLGLPKETRYYFWRTLIRITLKNPKALRQAGLLMALYLDLGPFSQYVAGRVRHDIESEEPNSSKFPIYSCESQEESNPTRVHS